MAKYCEIEFKNDRRKEIVNQKNNAIERALTAVGMQGEGYAKKFKEELIFITKKFEANTN